MQVRENKVCQALRSGGTVLSSSVRLPEPGLCEVLGYAGFDFVLLDGEHGALDPSTLDRMVQSCFAGDTVPVVRMLRPRDAEAVMHRAGLSAALGDGPELLGPVGHRLPERVDVTLDLDRDENAHRCYLPLGGARCCSDAGGSPQPAGRITRRLRQSVSPRRA